MAVNDMRKTCFEVYRTPEGEFRAFLQAENPQRVRTVLLPVSNRRAAGLLAAQLGEEFANTGKVRRSVPAKLRRRTLPRLLYEYVGHLCFDEKLQWKTAIGYRRQLEGLFRDCRWQRFADVSVEGFLAWRERSGRGGLHANRVLRAAKAFFDALVIAGGVPANPLRAVQPLAQSASTTGGAHLARLLSDPSSSEEEVKPGVFGLLQNQDLQCSGYMEQITHFAMSCKTCDARS